MASRLEKVLEEAVKQGLLSQKEADAIWFGVVGCDYDGQGMSQTGAIIEEILEGDGEDEDEDIKREREVEGPDFCPYLFSAYIRAGFQDPVDFSCRGEWCGMYPRCQGR